MSALVNIATDFYSSPYYKQIEESYMGGLCVNNIVHNGIKAPVYKPIILAFLFCKHVPIILTPFDESPNQVSVIDGTQYIPTYIAGFLSGCDYFQRHYGVSSDVEYSENYIKTIKYHFCDNGIVPWSGWYQPDIMGTISHDSLKELGYRAGILSMVEKLAERNKALSNAIEPCMQRKYAPTVNKYKPNYTKNQPAKPNENERGLRNKPGRKPNLGHPQFYSFIGINYKHRDKLMQYLIDNYTNKKAGQLAPMLYALVRLGAILKSELNGVEHTEIHRALKVTFGNVGGRSSIATALHLYEPEDASEKHKRKIDNHYQQIESFLSGK